MKRSPCDDDFCGCAGEVSTFCSTTAPHPHRFDHPPRQARSAAAHDAERLSRSKGERKFSRWPGCAQRWSLRFPVPGPTHARLRGERSGSAGHRRRSRPVVFVSAEDGARDLSVRPNRRAGIDDLAVRALRRLLEDDRRLILTRAVPREPRTSARRRERSRGCRRRLASSPEESIRGLPPMIRDRRAALAMLSRREWPSRRM